MAQNSTKISTYTGSIFSGTQHLQLRVSDTLLKPKIISEQHPNEAYSFIIRNIISDCEVTPRVDVEND